MEFLITLEFYLNNAQISFKKINKKVILRTKYSDSLPPFYLINPKHNWLETFVFWNLSASNSAATNATRPQNNIIHRISIIHFFKSSTIYLIYLLFQETFSFVIFSAMFKTSNQKVNPWKYRTQTVGKCINMQSSGKTNAICHVIINGWNKFFFDHN